MTEYKNMDQTTYNNIAKNPDKGNWDKNVVMLRTAIQHIDDDQGSLWSTMIPLLPSERPYTSPEVKLEGLKAIFDFRKEVVEHLGGFEALQESGKFNQTQAWESSRDKDSLGYTDDGFEYTLDGTTLKMKWTLDKNTSRYGCYEDFDVSPEDLKAAFGAHIPSDSEHKYLYINGVDHLYTKLIWNVVSGLQGHIFSFGVSGLFYSVADVFGCEIPSNEPNAQMLNPYLHDPYKEMLNAAV